MDTDIFLIRKMKSGSNEACDRFVRKYYNDIYVYCRAHCGNQTDAEDLVQEVFVRFFSHLEEYHHLGKAKNYLYTLARNICIDYGKKKIPIPVEEIFEMEDGSVEGDFAEKVQNHMTLTQALEQLSLEFREVIELYYFGDRKIKEIAEILGIGQPLVKYRLKQAKEQLRKGLEEKEVEDDPLKKGMLQEGVSKSC